MKFKNPYIIAEISGNHCGSFEKAKKLIKCAKINGADAVKLQTYTADMMTIKSSKSYFKINDGLWKGYDLWDLYNKAHTPLSWHPKLFNYAKEIGITLFSTPFSEEAVDYLEKLNCPFYKVASFEMTDHPLVAKISRTKKPIIISTGMANLQEIEATVRIAKKNGAKKIILLYCVSNYPSDINDFNLANIEILKKKFKCDVGLSDHSKDNRVAAAAVIAGAEVFEKHIALDNQKKGHDIKFSLKGKELRTYRNEIDLSHKLLGKNKFKRDKSEDKSKIFRRSIYANKVIKKGEKFNINNIKRRRPNIGLEPKYYDYLLNKKSPKNYKPGESISKKILGSI